MPQNIIRSTQKLCQHYSERLGFLHSCTHLLYQCYRKPVEGIFSFHVGFWQNPHCPPEIDLPEGLEGDRTVLEHLADIVETQARCNLFAEQHLREQSLKMKAQYDKHATENPIHPGDTVFVFQPKLQVRLTKRKLQRNYHGPYMVSEYNTLKPL